MLEVAEAKTLSKSLYTILKIEDLFQRTSFQEKHLRQLNRISHQFNTINRKIRITNNHVEDYIKWNSEKTPEHPMTENECFIESVTLFCSFELAHYELLKRFFLEALLLDKLGNKTNKTINAKSTYGTLVKSFKALPNFDTKMHEMLDEDLRNALAHDTWYFEDNQMRYNNFSNELVKIPITQIPQKFNIILAAYSTITRNYYEDFESDMIKIYKTIGSKKINEGFPLFGMDEDSIY